MKRMTVKTALSAVLMGGMATASQAGPFFHSSSPSCGCNSPYNAQPAATQNLVPVANGTVYTEGVSEVIPASMTTSNVYEAGAIMTAPAVLPSGAAASDHQGIPHVRLVNSRSLVLNFDVKGAGPSGVGNVELWYTRNGQVWQKYQAGAQTQSPFAIDVPEDGLYGFTTVAVSGVGLAPHRPAPGDEPQAWIEVDTTRPDVHILGTQAGVDESGRTLTIRWSAADKNLGSHPITLYYAGAGQTTWAPFATNLPNTGHFTWKLVPGLPAQVIVRVEATDRVGNTGADQTTMPTPVDVALPSATITGIDHNGGIQAVSNP